MTMASFEVLQLAAEEVIAKKKSLRAVAMSYDIDKMTLLRFCKKVKDGVPYKSGYSHHKLFFTEAEEHELVNYLLDLLVFRQMKQGSLHLSMLKPYKKTFQIPGLPIHLQG